MESQRSEADARKCRMDARAAAIVLADAPAVAEDQQCIGSQLVLAGGASSISLPLSSAQRLGIVSDMTPLCAKETLSHEEATALTESAWPLGLAQCTADLFKKGCSLKSQIQSTRRDLSQMGQQRQSFGQVKYPRRCKGPCACDVSPNLSKFCFRQLEKLLRTTKKDHVLVRVRSLSDAGSLWYCPLWSPQAGVHEFRASFCRVESVAFDDSELDEVLESTGYAPALGGPGRYFRCSMMPTPHCLRWHCNNTYHTILPSEFFAILVTRVLVQVGFVRASVVQ